MDEKARDGGVVDEDESAVAAGREKLGAANRRTEEPQSELDQREGYHHHLPESRDATLHVSLFDEPRLLLSMVAHQRLCLNDSRVRQPVGDVLNGDARIESAHHIEERRRSDLQ